MRDDQESLCISERSSDKFNKEQKRTALNEQRNNNMNLQ